MNDDNNFGLFAWIKKEQEEIRRHKVKMAIKNYRDDEVFLTHISHLVQSWNKLKIKEREFLMNLKRWREEGRVFTVNQRSAIMSLYLKYELS